MKELFFFILIMGLSFIPEIISLVKKGKNAQPKARPAVDPDPYFPDADDEDTVAYDPVGSASPETDSCEYFSYETIPDEQPVGMTRTENSVPFSPVKDEKSTAFKDKGESSNAELTFDEEDIYKGVIFSEILKRKYI